MPAFFTSHAIKSICYRKNKKNKNKKAQNHTLKSLQLYVNKQNMSILNILFNTVFVLSQLIITNACTYCSCSVGKYAELGSGPAYYSDCLDIYTANTASQNGAYSINPNGQGAFQVYCDFTHTGGPWNVFRKFNPPKPVHICCLSNFTILPGTTITITFTVLIHGYI